MPQRFRRLWRATLAAGILAGAAIIANAEPAGLLQPVDCQLGETCFIQQYVDRDPGKGAVDFTCGPLSYDGHKGTDFRVADLAAMAAGVDVVSATAGRVLATRDGMADHAQFGRNAPDVEGRECGNAVLIERADGWQFQYCHLARGSVAVSPGDAVEPGQKLGRIGLSGMTQFPHLHFQVRDQAGRIIDPFDAREQNESCRLTDRRTMWATLSPIADYQPGGPLSAGFADGIPDYDDVRAGTAGLTTLPPDAAGLVFWAHFFGLRSGDRLSLTLFDPDGAELARDAHDATRPRATQFRAVGRRTRTPWPPGVYRGRAVLLRDGAEIDEIEASVTVR